MTQELTRRSFLKLSAAGIAGSAAAELHPLFQASAGAKGSQIEVWLTNATERCAKAPSLAWSRASGAAPVSAVRLDPSKKYQTILGFGGAFTDSACYMMSKLSPEARAGLLREMFHPTQMGLSVCRTCMGASDYATEVFSYDEGEPDPELTRFSIDHDRKHVLPVLREASKVNPDLFLFSSPWSPPGWMKSGGSMLGGSMRRKYLGSYANYFVKFIQAYGNEGVRIQAVTPQNEVDTDQDGRMPACIWPQEYEMEFVKVLGPLLRQNGLATKIWILDHNYNLWGRALCELEDAGVREYCSGVAWHGYVGKPEMMSRVHGAFPEIGMHWTEGGPDYTSPDYQTDWAHWTKTFASALQNWCESITAWNLALDEKGRPNIGPFPCGGVVTIHSESGAITRSGQFWALAHFSRFIRRGAKRLDSQCGMPEVAHVFAENPDGLRVLVLGNNGAARTVEVRVDDRRAEVDLAVNGVASLVWRA